MDIVDAAVGAVRSLSRCSLETRVRAYNAITKAAAALVADVSTDPVLAVQLVPSGDVHPNGYNPNKVAAPELDLLETSIRADGVTMPVVVVLADAPGGGVVVVDGFHRQSVIRERLGRAFVPCSVIAAPQGDLMASTIRHNRARGKHQVDAMSTIVRDLAASGWSDAAIAEKIGLTAEETLRLKQQAGCAVALAAKEYPRAWERPGGPNPPGK
jgi:ParB-like chromosome segregation protein Spo0J